MKTHPAFIHFMECVATPTSDWSRGLTDWKFRGCPVVEEEPTQKDFPWYCGNAVLNLRGSFDLDAFPELRQAIMDARKREADLAAANEKIKELERRDQSHMGHYCIHDGLWKSVSANQDYTCPACRNAALEEAARAIDDMLFDPATNWRRSDTDHWSGESVGRLMSARDAIRAMKKEAK